MSHPVPSTPHVSPKVERHSQPNLLPVVRRVIEQLNQLFIDHSGLLGKSLVAPLCLCAGCAVGRSRRAQGFHRAR